MQFAGTWYLFASAPTVLETNRKCQVINVFRSPESSYYDLYYISTIDGTIQKETGMLGSDGWTTVMIRIFPLQYTTGLELMLSGEGYMVIYSCSACGLYGT